MSHKINKTKTLLSLGPCDCRWPIGDPRQAGFGFCGAQQVAGRPYCEEHWNMSFDTAKPRSVGGTVTTFVRRAA